MRGSFLFLGSGASLGVPVIGCSCSICQSHSPYNHRLRPSGLITIDNKTFLIDAGPDLRTQALKYHLKHLDGLLLTHTHFDHVAGLDDLRPYSFFEKKALPCLLSKESFDQLKICYHYLMHPLEGEITSTKHFQFHLLDNDFGQVKFEGIPIHYLSYSQAGMKVTGYRLGDLAYISDIRDYSLEVVEAIKGVKTLILSALRSGVSEVHFSIDEACRFAQLIGAERTFFTHISHDVDHEETNRTLPSHIQLGYDGLQITFEI